MNLDNYNNEKRKLEILLEKIKQLALQQEISSVISDVTKSIERLREENFQLVVVGEFSRGKSTLINAMLGKRILPAKASPTTALINKIKYGDKISYRLFYRDNRKSKKISEEEFKKLVAPKNIIQEGISAIQNMFSNAEQEKLDSISYVEIECPLEFCRNNVNIIDTPGTNDLNTGRVEITYKYIEKADAIILLLSATQPLTSSETNFLKERILNNQIKEIFFVANHKDLIEDSSKKIINYCIKNIQDEFPELKGNIKIHLVSSKQALLYRRKYNNKEVLKPKQEIQLPSDFYETGFVEYEDALGSFLANEKGKAKLRKYAEKGMKYAKIISASINTSLELSREPLAEINSKYMKLEPEFHKAKAEVSRLTQLLRYNLESKVGELSSKCVIASNNMRNSANQAVNDYSGNYSEGDIREKVNIAIDAQLKSFIKEVTTLQQNAFSSEVANINGGLKRIWRDINVGYNESSVQYIDIEAEYDLDIDVSDSIEDIIENNAGTIAGAVIGGVIAGPLGAFVGGWVGSQFSNNNSESTRKKIEHKINMNYKENADSLKHSVINQYMNNINNVCGNIECTVNNRINDMDKQLKTIIEQKASIENNTKAIQIDLEQKRNVLDSIHSDLTRIANGG